MHVVESLTDAITAPINAVLGKAKVKSDYLQTGSSSLSGRHTLFLTNCTERRIIGGMRRENDAAFG